MRLIYPLPQPCRHCSLTLVLVLFLFLTPSWSDTFTCRDCVFAQQSQTDSSTDTDAAKPKRSPGSPTEQARTYLESEKIDDAIALLNGIVASSSEGTELQQAYLLLGTAYGRKRQFNDAITYLDRLITEFPKSGLVGRAKLLIGAAQVEMGNIDQGLPSLAEARSLSPDLDVKLEALRLTGEAYAKKKDFHRALQAWRDQIGLAPDDQKEAVRQQIREMVLHRLDKLSLNRLHEASPREFPGDLALIRLIELHASAGDDHLTERTSRRFLELFPEHEYASNVAERLASLKTKLKMSRYVVATVLPLSGGKLSTFGNEALNGLRLALERAKEIQEQVSIGLLIKDSEETRNSLRADLLELMGEYRPIAVIGPLLTRDLQAVSGLAGQTEIPFITPSASLDDVHRLGNFVFSTALTASPQARRLADYALRSGHKRFCILHPENPYGQELARLFAQEIRQRGGEIIAVDSYKDGDTDFGAPIKRIKAADLKKYGKSTSVRMSKGATRNLYTPGFDALFIPGSSRQVGLLVPQLAFHDVKVMFLGANAWSSPELLRTAGRYLEGSVFADGFFPESPDPEVKEFVQLYRQRYQTEPSLFSAQAYDAMRFVLDAIKRGATSGKTVRDILAKSQDLPSLSGSVAFTPLGTLDHRVVLIQVKQGKLVRADEPPAVER